MIEKVLIFILFLGPLIFFHELGHYLFARLFGVRVEVFSIGFGPKIFKFKRGFTEYAISLIPLGGYVKMFGDNPLTKNEIPEEERKYSFTFKGKWARFWIVAGGPLANFILAYVIFFSLFMSGEKIPEIKLGVLQEQSSLYKLGLRSGDVLYKLNKKEIYNPSDIALEGANLIRTVGIKRNNQDREVQINLDGESFFKEILKHPPLLRKPIVVDGKGKMYAVSFNPDRFSWKKSFAEMNYFEEHNRVYLLPIKGEKVDPNIQPEVDKKNVLSLKMKMGERLNFVKGLASLGYRTLDLKVKDVNKDSPAERAGIKKGDVIFSLQGAEVFSFEELRKRLQKTDTDSVDMKILSSGEVKTISLRPDVKEISGESVKLIGVYSGGLYQGLNFIDTGSKGIVQSFILSFARTWDTLVKTVEGFKKLITGNVSIKSIGGPLAIGKVASDSFNTSLSYFFQLMALISINLGIINLFPIPVLDGGHIMFIFFEMMNRGPISKRKMEIAQQVGLSFLLVLMLGALFNDFSRFF